MHEITPRKMHEFDISCHKAILSPYSFAQNNRHLHFMTTTLFTDLGTKLVTPYIEGLHQKRRHFAQNPL